MQKCIECSIKLSEENWLPSCRKENYKICKNCSQERSRNYYKDNLEKIKTKHKHYYQRHKDLLKLRSRNYWQKKYYSSKEFRERKKEKTKIWTRLNILTTKNGRRKVRKRQFYGICELCGHEILKRPFWHHWDESNLDKGLWLDNQCHQAVEASEKNGITIPLYSKLKELIEFEIFA